jgi:hypothetical protein
MNGTIKAIETRYKGYRFRSRLEARWAVFFDALEIAWEYEPEGFDLGEHGRYLPDFYLSALGVWVEIKPNTGFDEIAFGKCEALARLSKETTFLVFGTPYTNEHIVYTNGTDPDFNLTGRLTETREEGRGYVLSITDQNRRIVLQTASAPDLAYAFACARSARFEHGEEGGEG